MCRSSVLLSLYQKNVSNDVRSFVSSNNHLIGFVLVSVEDKKATLCTCYSVWDVIYNNLVALNYFDQQVPLVYTVLIKALSNVPIFDTIGWKAQCFRKLSFPITTSWSALQRCSMNKGMFDGREGPSTESYSNFHNLHGRCELQAVTTFQVVR